MQKFSRGIEETLTYDILTSLQNIDRKVNSGDFCYVASTLSTVISCTEDLDTRTKIAHPSITMLVFTGVEFEFLMGVCHKSKS